MTVPKKRTSKRPPGCIPAPVSTVSAPASTVSTPTSNPQTPPPPSVSAIHKDSNKILEVGDWVKVNSIRVNRLQYNNQIGQIRLISKHGIAYCVIDRACPCFYLEELEAVEVLP